MKTGKGVFVGFRDYFFPSPSLRGFSRSACSGVLLGTTMLVTRVSSMTFVALLISALVFKQSKFEFGFSDIRKNEQEV